MKTHYSKQYLPISELQKASWGWLGAHVQLSAESKKSPITSTSVSRAMLARTDMVLRAEFLFFRYKAELSYCRASWTHC